MSVSQEEMVMLPTIEEVERYKSLREKTDNFSKFLYNVSFGVGDDNQPAKWEENLSESALRKTKRGDYLMHIKIIYELPF